MEYKYNDGGRAAAGITGGVNDCVSRALAIVTGRPYKEVAAELAPLTTKYGIDVYSATFLEYMRAAGFNWIASTYPTQVQDLPEVGRFVVFTPNHLTALVDGVINDVFNPFAETIRGYWVKASRFNVYRGETKINSYPLNAAQAKTMRDLYTLNYAKGLPITVKPV